MINIHSFNTLTVSACMVSSLCQASDKDKRDKHPFPNILLICADDLGWSDIGSYGSEIETPNLDALAKSGVRFTQYYNTSKSFPSRAALLTGLYAQQNGYDKKFRQPLQNSMTLGEYLKSSGYITLWSGKHHGMENPRTRGFDHYYGLKDGACNYFNPGNQRFGEGIPAQKKHNRIWCIEDKEYAPYTPMEPDFYTTDYFTKYALSWLDEYRDDERPFFLYMAYTAPHDPLMAWPEDIAKYKGKYAGGYEAIRKARFEKQKELGITDDRYQLSSPTYSDWNSLTPQQRAEEERKMEVYAAMIDRMDQNIGKLFDKLKEQGKFDNTLIIFLSDNGASGEVVELPGSYGEIGSLTSWTSLGENWANVCNTPLRYFKNYSYEGGIATPLIISWKNGLEQPDRNSDFTGHFIDIMATFVDLTKTPYPSEFNGRKILPYEGESLMPVIYHQKSKRERPIFWEWQHGQAARDGRWKLVKHGLENSWSLFNMRMDPSETEDMASKHPEIVQSMDKMFKEWKQRVSLTDKE